ncbi:MAG TPA: hypothetical protein PL090_05615 [Syntrophales bacterium]|nr:hypothetical protein [Syntrophales bacterium]
MQKIESLITRCPKLGCDIPFSYCLRERGSLPCARILACWAHRVPVEDFLRERLTEDQWDQAFLAPDRDRLSAILTAAGKAKKE